MKKFLLTSLVALVILPVALFLPITYNPSTHSVPAKNFDEAIARADIFQTKDDEVALYPGCESQVMTHGQKVEQVIVLLHGYRNCPKQFYALGTIFYEQGYNVIIPRMPHHGLADVLATDQAQLTADELAAHVTEAVDIAEGLGDDVTVAGISTGGVLAGLAAQNRSDIDQAVLIAPVFGLHIIPTELTTPAINLFQILPNFFLWQNKELKAEAPNPPQVYPQNATRAVSQILRLASGVRDEVDESQPAASTIIVVTNANDTAVNNEMTSDVVVDWQKSGFEHLETYEFEANLQLDHDLIDPTHPKQKIDLVYPVLIDLITQ
ncbi:MAG: alpha/beta fold hydrolase [Anaerolineae bacterium]|nr:alpha/beta fold hydrolase [Anaerolineae bacterium]